MVTPSNVTNEYEKKSVKQEDVGHLMEWLNNQSHLPQEGISELDLILAHHSCSCDIEITKHALDLNYTLRTILNFYQNREIDQSVELALQTWLISPLSTPTNKGYTAIYCQLLDADTKKFVYSDVIRAFTMVLDLWQHERGTVPGVVFIVNCDKVTLGHIARVNLIVAQQFFYFLQEAMFVRLKEFHFINAPVFIDKLLALVKPFMKEQLLDILKIHTVDSCTIDEYISRSALPIDAGGNDKDSITMRDEIWNKLRENRKFYEDDLKKRVDELKRPGGPKTLSSFFPGLEEHFKDLVID